MTEAEDEGTWTPGKHLPGRLAVHEGREKNTWLQEETPRVPGLGQLCLGFVASRMREQSQQICGALCPQFQGTTWQGLTDLGCHPGNMLSGTQDNIRNASAEEDAVI